MTNFGSARHRQSPLTSRALNRASKRTLSPGEIAGYGTVRAFAKLLDDAEAGEFLTATFDEKSATDEKLTEISESLNLRPNRTKASRVK
ncbi:MAG: DUF892 family protein [Verrucomicrobiota bacterium]